MNERQSTIERARARDAGIRRLRRLTVAGVAAATALAGLFSGLAAKAVPGRSTATTPATGTGTRTSAATTTLPAASDPIVPATGSGSPSGSTPQAPAQTPSTTQAPPVVSSGGS